MPTSTANVVILSDTVSGKINAARLLDIPVNEAISRWLDVVIDDAKENAPRDTGEMADTLKKYIGVGTFPQAAGIKSNSRKFPFVHGKVAIPAPARRRSIAHWPPPTQSLTRWAQRHGIPVFLVQRAIAEKGTPIIPFLSEAVDRQLPLLDAELRRAAEEIGKVWSV